MGIVHKSQVNSGHIIKDPRYGDLHYVHDKAAKIEGGDIVVDYFITTPVQQFDPTDEMEGVVDFGRAQVQNAYDLPQHMAVMFNEGFRKIYPSPDGMVSECGRVNHEIRDRAATIYENTIATQRIADLPVPVRGQDLTNATQGVVGALPLDGTILDHSDRAKPIRPNKSPVLQPDMYLETALERGLITPETYQLFQSQRDTIVTLRDAWNLANAGGMEELVKQFEFEKFEEKYNVGQYDEQDDNPYLNDSTIEYARAQSISWDDANERGFIDDVTHQALSRGDGYYTSKNGEEYKIKEMGLHSLWQAFAITIGGSHFLEDYYSPTATKQNRKLNTSQVKKVTDDIASAYNKLTLEAFVVRAQNELNAAVSKIGNLYLEGDSDSFLMSPNFDKPLTRAAKKESLDKRTSIVSNRPDQILAFPS